VPPQFWPVACAVSGFLIAAMMATLIRLHTDRHTKRDDPGEGKDQITAADMRAGASLRLGFIDLIASNIVVGFLLGAIVVAMSMAAILLSSVPAFQAGAGHFARSYETSAIVLFALFGCTVFLVFYRFTELLDFDLAPGSDGR
jgi:hypothetical protein